MNKEEIMTDTKFIQLCHKFGLNDFDFEIQGNLIVLKVPNQDIYVFLDSNYNIVTMEQYGFKPDIDICNGLYYSYANFNGIHMNSEGIGDPFSKFTLKQITDIANRVNTVEKSSGYNCMIEINGIWYEADRENKYLQLISYVKFLNEEIKLYWETTYPLRSMGFEVPDVYTYLKTIIRKINECLSIYESNNRRPRPIDIMTYIGQRPIYINSDNNKGTDLKIDGSLNDIIDLLMNEKDKEIFNDHKNSSSLSDLALNLLELLDVSDMEVLENRKQKGLCKAKAISAWLED